MAEVVVFAELTPVVGGFVGPAGGHGFGSFDVTRGVEVVLRAGRDDGEGGEEGDEEFGEHRSGYRTACKWWCGSCECD